MLPSSSTIFRRCLATVILLLGSAAAHAQYSYTATNLRALDPNISYASAFAVNNSGDVAGSSFAIVGGTVTANGGSWEAINNSGVAAGWQGTGGASAHAYLLTNGSRTDLASSVAYQALAYGINDSGQAVGYVNDGSGPRPVLFSGGSFTELGGVPAGEAYARDINNSGQIVGFKQAGQAFLISGGVYTGLGTLGGSFSAAYSISNSGGFVTGWAHNVSNASHAFLYQNGSMLDLGLLAGAAASQAYGVNSSGHVVGSSGSSAFIYKDGAMLDLNAITDFTGSGITHLEYAYGISDTGYIVGVGTSHLGTTAFLLTTTSAIPEPSTYAAIVGGLALIGAVVWRQRSACSSPRVR